MLGRLMAPLVAALNGNEALVTLSIRTLEYWVDSLNPEFLEPAMLPVIPQLMRALWSHLRPLPYNFSAKVHSPHIVVLLVVTDHGRSRWITAGRGHFRSSRLVIEDCV